MVVLIKDMVKQPPHTSHKNTAEMQAKVVSNHPTNQPGTRRASMQANQARVDINLNQTKHSSVHTTPPPLRLSLQQARSSRSASDKVISVSFGWTRSSRSIKSGRSLVRT
jgi:hypothetical protein